ncbi:MAG: bifunctional hydroxymethylpyrimidine kinase/phosphomethylpyrimidine kinase [Thermoplasmatales archaeon]|nr:MAG: bifunctional hydroxymethylpyrimidine kinase/phosphomethylpyrimidine kinase [Thermoplasmatales archaeon]
MEKKIALSIAGSDSSSGAGIQADLKSFSFLGLHGTTVVTCITSQNTKQVKTIHKLPVEIIENQIDILFGDFHIDAVKTGMLYDEEIVKCVAKKILEYKLNPVVDPVMVATSGDPLSQTTFIKSFKKYLLPKVFMVTANIPEAYEITGVKINSIDDFKKPCQNLFSLGPKYVLIKGGHLNTKNAIDVLYDGKKFHEFSLPRIPNKKAHGSGCTLSALITGLLALGKIPVEAVRKAKYITWDMIRHGYVPGNGSDVLNHSCEIGMPPTLPDSSHFEVWFELKNAVEKLISMLPLAFIPEVGVNFAFALKNAQKLEDICAIDGRIVKTKDKPRICGGIEFGVSKHIASIILATMSVNKNARSAVNISYSKNTLELCKKVGLSIGFFDRKNEPANVPSTMEWGTKQAIAILGGVPDIIYDIGDIGKEPMIRMLGNDPEDVLSKLKKIIKKYDKNYIF